MTENDYILCTNLAKVRIARDALIDMMFPEGPEEKEQLAIYRKLTRIMERLEKQVVELTEDQP